MLRKSLITAIVCVFASPFVHARGPQDPNNLVNVDLLRLRTQMVRRMSVEQIEAHNASMLASLPPAVYSTNRALSISPYYAARMIETLWSHPIAGFGDAQYQQPHVKIGYCFGRAAYAHIALLKLGLTKRGIKKIWAVGPMNTGDTSWAFHVATLAITDSGWMTIDNFPGRAMTAQQWMEHMKKISTDGKLMFFITDPQKFSVSLHTYDRVQLGLDLDRQTDWYKHYFKDLMKWFSNDKAAREFFQQYQVFDLRNPPQA